MNVTTTRSHKLAALLALGACAAFATVALAQDHGKRPAPHGTAARGPAGMEQELKKLGATDAQLEQLRKLHFATLEKAIDLQAAAHKAGLKLHALMIEGDASDADLLAAFDASSKANAALGRLHMEGMLEARKILGPELTKKVHAAHPGMGHPGMGGPGMGGPGMGHPGMGPGMAHPGMGPGMGHPGMGHPGMGGPGMGHPGMGHDGKDLHGRLLKHLHQMLGGHCEGCQCDKGRKPF